MFQNNWIIWINWFTLTVLSSTRCWLNPPNGVVSFFIVNTNLLIARITSKGHWSQWQRVEIKFFIAKITMSGQTNVLTISDLSILEFIGMFNSKGWAGTWTVTFGWSSDSISITWNHLFVRVSNKNSISAHRSKSNWITWLKATIFSKSKASLYLTKMSIRKLLLTPS